MLPEQAENIGLLPVAERDAAGGPVLDEEETVLHKFEGVQLVIGASANQGEGTVFITEWRVFWLSAADPALGYSCDFTTMGIHAVVADEDSANKPCLYIQLNTGEDEEGEGGALDAGSDDEEEAEEEGEGQEGDSEQLLPELHFIPADTAQVEPLFQAFCEGAERNPDWSEGKEEGAGEFFYDEDEVLAGAAQATLGVDDVSELVGEDPGRFEDAEDEEDEEAAAAGQQPNGGC